MRATAFGLRVGVGVVLALARSVLLGLIDGVERMLLEEADLGECDTPPDVGDANGETAFVGALVLASNAVIRVCKRVTRFLVVRCTSRDARAVEGAQEESDEGTGRDREGNESGSGRGRVLGTELGAGEERDTRGSVGSVGIGSSGIVWAVALVWELEARVIKDVLLVGGTFGLLECAEHELAARFILNGRTGAWEISDFTAAVTLGGNGSTFATGSA